MRALITGATGFVGPYLMKLLLSRGYDVCGTYYDTLPYDNEFVSVHFEKADITDDKTVKRIISDYLPDEIYHLAGIAATSGISKELYYKINFGGTVTVLDAASSIIPKSRVLIVGSATSYGNVTKECQPIREEQALRPIDHYAASKAAADMSACAYAAAGLHVVRTRSFNHTGPGQNTSFVCSRLAKLISEVAIGKRDPIIEIGNIESIRDFTDVRDVVKAYWLLLQKGQSGEAYNVCSQKAFSIKEIIYILSYYSGIEIQLNTNPELIRQIDIPVILGCRENIFKNTSWEPKISINETLHDMFKYWSARIKL